MSAVVVGLTWLACRVLAIGNYLNGQGPRGGAYGFRCQRVCLYVVCV